MQQRESQKKEDSPAPNVREVAKCCGFSNGSWGESKSRLVKAAGAESCGQRSNQKLHAAVATSTSSSQNAKKLRVSEHFLGSSDVEKIARRCGEKHVRFGPRFEVPMSNHCTPLWPEDARSTFSSENVQNTSGSDQFLKFRCQNIARHCGEKRVSKSKC